MKRFGEMGYFLKINHSNHDESFTSLHNYPGKSVYLIGSDSREGVWIHRVILGAASGLLKTVIEDIPISELDCVLLPDITTETLHLLVMFLYNGGIQCSKEHYQVVIELMQLLCIDCSELALTDMDGNGVEFEIPVQEEQLRSYGTSDDSETHIEIALELVGSTYSISPGPISQSTGSGSMSESVPVSDGAPSGKRRAAKLCNAKLLLQQHQELQDQEEATMYNSEDQHYTPQDKQLSGVMYSCSMCEKSFSTLAFLETHMERHHQMEQYKAPRKIFRCSLCSFVGELGSDIRKHHREMHCDQLKFTCSICPKMFSTKKQLYCHVRNVHRPKPFKCDLCVFSCSRPSQLKLHTSSVHYNEKPNSCPICGKCFGAVSSMNSHVRRFHEDKIQQ